MYRQASDVKLMLFHFPELLLAVSLSQRSRLGQSKNQVGNVVWLLNPVQVARNLVM